MFSCCALIINHDKTPVQTRREETGEASGSKKGGKDRGGEYRYYREMPLKTDGAERSRIVFISGTIISDAPPLRAPTDSSLSLPASPPHDYVRSSCSPFSSDLLHSYTASNHLPAWSRTAARVSCSVVVAERQTAVQRWRLVENGHTAVTCVYDIDTAVAAGYHRMNGVFFQRFAAPPHAYVCAPHHHDINFFYISHTVLTVLLFNINGYVHRICFVVPSRERTDHMYVECYVPTRK